MKDNNKEPARKSYSFSPVLQDYLIEKLKMERLKIKTMQAGNQLSEIDKRAIKKNDRRKVARLNNDIFCSMANLIYFFEFINEHPELEGIFDEDVEDLLGFRGPHAQRFKVDDPKYLTFFRLMSCILNYDGNDIISKKEGDKVLTTRRIKKIDIITKGKTQFDKSRNIRLQLARAISECTYQIILNLGTKKDFRLGTKIMAGDLGRAQFWADYCTSDIKLNLNNPHRRITF